MMNRHNMEEGNIIEEIYLHQAWFGKKKERLDARLELLLEYEIFGTFSSVNILIVYTFWIMIYFVVILVQFGFCTDLKL